MTFAAETIHFPPSPSSPIFSCYPPVVISPAADGAGNRAPALVAGVPRGHGRRKFGSVDEGRSALKRLTWPGGVEDEKVRKGALVSVVGGPLQGRMGHVRTKSKTD